MTAWMGAGKVLGMDSLSPSEVMQHMLGVHTMVRAYYNVNHPQLRLPADVIASHQDRGIVMLELGYNLPAPIYGWSFLEQALECTCSFGRELFNCVLPWDALFMVTPTDETVQCAWPTALRDVSTAMGERTVKKLDKLLAETPEPPKPRHLKAVK